LLGADQLRLLGEAIGRELRPEPLSNELTRAELEQTMLSEYVEAFFIGARPRSVVSLRA
jgi:hypothetical protein